MATLLLAVALVFGAACSKDEGLKITGISPNSGPAQGQGAVTIHGNGFESGGAKAVTVYFGDKQGRVVRFDSDTELVVAPPPGEPGTKVDLHIIFGDAREHTFPQAYEYKAEDKAFGVDSLVGGEKAEGE